MSDTLADKWQEQLLAIADSYEGRPITDDLEREATLTVESWIHSVLMPQGGYTRRAIRFVVWANRNERSLRIFLDVDPMRDGKWW